MAEIDHLVYAVPDLAGAIDRVEELLGTRPAPGGSHPGLGTHNALVSMGSCYLELIAPDPGQPDPEGPRPFGVDDVTAPRLVTFAARPSAGETIDELVATMRAAGVDPGDPVPMSRATPDGDELHWRLTFPTLEADGLVPFLIDWGDTPNPATTSPTGPTLAALTGTTTDTATAEAVLSALGLDVGVTAPSPDDPAGLRATLHTPGHRTITL